MCVCQNMEKYSNSWFLYYLYEAHLTNEEIEV